MDGNPVEDSKHHQPYAKPRIYLALNLPHLHVDLEVSRQLHQNSKGLFPEPVMVCYYEAQTGPR